MPLNVMALAAEGATDILDSNTITFVVNGAKEILGIMTTPPLGVFLTIGIVGSVAGLVAVIVRMVKR